MNKVLIQNGLVHEIFGEVAPELHPDLLVVDAPTDVEAGYSYTDGAFTAPEAPAEPTYQELRAAEYPAIGDQLDALWKGGGDAAAMLEQVMTVKAKYPKV